MSTWTGVAIIFSIFFLIIDQDSPVTFRPLLYRWWKVTKYSGCWEVSQCYNHSAVRRQDWGWSVLRSSLPGQSELCPLPTLPRLADPQPDLHRQLSSLRESLRNVSWGHLSAGLPECSVQTYGSGDQLRFDCHFGPKECEGNIYHACAATLIEGAEERLDYIRCMINDNYEPARAALRCSREVEVDWGAIQRCATTSQGARLHQLAGEKTRTLRPRVSFIKRIRHSTDCYTPVIIITFSILFSNIKWPTQFSQCSAVQCRQCQSDTIFIKLFLFVQKFFSSAGEENRML